MQFFFHLAIGLKTLHGLKVFKVALCQAIGRNQDRVLVESSTHWADDFVAFEAVQLMLGDFLFQIIKGVSGHFYLIIVGVIAAGAHVIVDIVSVTLLLLLDFGLAIIDS